MLVVADEVFRVAAIPRFCQWSLTEVKDWLLDKVQSQDGLSGDEKEFNACWTQGIDVQSIS